MGGRTEERKDKMEVREMTAAEHVETARVFLAQSNAEFDAGDPLQGAEKLYGAATHAVSANAQQRSWEYHSHRAMKNAVYRLADELDDLSVISGFSAAEKFHRHFFHQIMEPYEIEGERPAVHAFVHRMLDLTA